MLMKSGAKLLDFGLARLLEGDAGKGFDEPLTLVQNWTSDLER